MLQTLEYRLSVTPEPYESAPTPEDFSLEEIKAQAAVEEKYAEAMAKHAAWKEAKAAAEQEAKLRSDREAQVAKVEALRQRAEEKRKEEERKAEEKQQEEERLCLLKEREDAAERKRLDDLKEKELDEAAEKKRKDDLAKKERKEAVKKLRKEQKKKEKAEKAAESVRLPDAAELLREEKGTDGDSEGELSEVSRVQARQYLREKRDGKWRVVEPRVSSTEGRKRKRVTKSVSMVDSGEEGVAGSSKRVKLEITGPAEGEDEFLGNSEYFPPSVYRLLISVSEHCMRCRLDSARCFAKPASEKSNRGWTCSHCKVKKSACSFNKGTTLSLVISSEEISEVLQNLVATVTVLAGKVDSLTGKVASLRSRIGDLCDDYCTEDLESPSDFLSDSEPEGWKASCMELYDLEGVNSEALRRVMGFRLDRDMAQLRKGGLAEPEKVDPEDL